MCNIYKTLSLQNQITRGCNLASCGGGVEPRVVCPEVPIRINEPTLVVGVVIAAAGRHLVAARLAVPARPGITGFFQVASMD